MTSRHLSRRALARNGLALAGALAFAGQASAQQDISADLAKPSALGDEVLGKADAPVTIIEYASMTCSHCAHFHQKTFPLLKSKYIDTGKVRFILREFPLDPLATAGFMLARCAGPGKYYPLTGLLFDQQETWAFADKPADALLATVKQAGFTQESFDTCLKDQKIFDAINATRQLATDKLGVNSTPTFFINGKIHRGAFEPEAMAKLIDPLLGKS
jgi:protein-disulfide isomerase